MQPKSSLQYSQQTGATRHLSLYWAISIQSGPHPTCWRSFLMFSSHLCLGLPSDPLPTDLPSKNLYAPLLPPICTICPAHLIIFDWVSRIIFGVEYTAQNPPLRSVLHSPVTSYLIGPNNFLSTLFSHALSLCSSLNVNDQVSHPYKTGKITVLFTYIYIFLGSKLQDKRFCSEW